ncbi:MAG: adenylate/guanylate cyclase domain-containing protein [Cyanobacteria bacterium P01_H01_bin.119]
MANIKLRLRKALRVKSRPLLSGWSRRLPIGGYIAVVISFALGYRLLVWLVFQFPLVDSSRPLPLWPPAAYSQLILLLLGLRFWPAIFLGSLLNAAYSGQPLWMDGAIAAVNNTIQALLGAWILLRLGFSARLDHLRDVGLLILFGALLPATVSATFGVLNCCFNPELGLEELRRTWFFWWIGNVSSVLILFPAVLLLPEWPRQIRSTSLRLIALAWMVSLGLLSWLVFSPPIGFRASTFPLEYLPFPFAVWGALRFGPSGAAAAILITAGFACLGFSQGNGPFFPNPTLLSGTPESQASLALMALSVYISVFVTTALSLAASMAEHNQARTDLLAEKDKSERLLLNILPQPIAVRLLEHQEQTIADQFAEVTVLFADIVGFTRLSSDLPPQVVVNMLNDIFSTFDRLADRHGLEKIKTIGDSYLVVGGLPTHRDDHAAAIAAMALDMQAAVEQFNQHGNHPQTFRIRIGINTGPVVAGVIGTKKFIYDLWGDTVNIASRMESMGIAGEIQVTQATGNLLKDLYQLEYRGEIKVKGKGLMGTYWLRDRHSMLNMS